MDMHVAIYTGARKRVHLFTDTQEEPGAAAEAALVAPWCSWGWDQAAPGAPHTGAAPRPQRLAPLSHPQLGLRLVTPGPCRGGRFQVRVEAPVSSSDPAGTQHPGSTGMRPQLPTGSRGVGSWGAAPGWV